MDKYWIETFRTKSKKWAWRLMARNGKTLAHSEEYNTKRARDDTVDNLCAELCIVGVDESKLRKK